MLNVFKNVSCSINNLGGNALAKILYKLGKFMAKNRWLSLISWILVLGVIATTLVINPPSFDDDITMNGLDSLDTNDKIAKEFHQDSEKASVKIVFHSSKDDGITEESTKKDIEKALDNIKQNDDYVHMVSNPYETGQINDDNDTAIATVSYVVDRTALKDSSTNIIDREMQDVKDNHNLQVEKSDASMDVEIGGISEVVGVVVAFVILLITFSSLIAAGMPIISAIIGLGTSIGIIALLTLAFDIPDLTLSLAVMIGLAVGIDYSLFILFRYKEVKKSEPNTIEAIGKAVGTAGSAVVFAGITVMVAVSGLSLVGIDFLSVMGFASALSVLFAVISALTLLPALISFFHKRIKVKEKDQNKKENSKESPWSKFVVNKPILAVLLSLVILVVAIIPVKDMRLGMPDDSLKPNDTSAHKAYNLIADNFGEGYNGQIVMLVNTKDGGSKNHIEQELNNIRNDIEDMDNVETVTPATLTDNNNYALLSIVPKEGPNAVSTSDLVYKLRDYDSTVKEQYDFDTEISGQSVINIDMSEKLDEAIPVFAGVIVALAFVLLVFVFRSILVPLKAVLGFVLSLMATLGFTTLVIQQGTFSSLFMVDNTGPLLAFLPVITIGLLFGLAIDYELFLMTRVHEEYSKTGDNDHAIRVGIKESGPVIVAAALIMFSVFIAFAYQDDIAIKSIGLALAFGVLFDAFIVRMTLIPALTKLFGNASWYLPRWLDKIIPEIDVEGKALEEEMNNKNSETYNDRGTHYEEQTTELYKALTSNTTDRDILFNALMLYASENNKNIYDEFNDTRSYDDDDRNE